MFYLVNTANETVRKAVSKVSLRRFRRKANDATLRIVEGDSLSKALKAEEKAAKKHAAEVSSEAPVKKAKKASKKATKKVAA